MQDKVFFEIHSGLEREAPGRNKYTKKAFEMIPRVDKPVILDVGCGPGTPTMLLAEMSGGTVIGMDLHQPYLDILQKKIDKSGFSDRVKTLNCSMFNIDFSDEYFDIIWAEGSIYNIGFQRGIHEWRRLIKKRGFLVVHEMIWLKPDPPKEIWEYWHEIYPEISLSSEKIRIIQKNGYKLIDYFDLPEDAWLDGYYNPLQKIVSILSERYIDDEEAMKVISEEQKEIDMYLKYSKWYGSAFFIMQKK